MCSIWVVSHVDLLILNFPGGSVSKEFTCNAGDLGLIPWLGRSLGGRHGNPFQYSCVKTPWWQRSLAGCSPWGRKESDMAKRLSTHSTAHRLPLTSYHPKAKSEIYLVELLLCYIVSTAQSITNLKKGEDALTTIQRNAGAQISVVAAAAAAAKSLQSCPTLQPQRWQTIRLHLPWDSPGKNTGVGCHFLLQCMKVKSESEVAQS